jgi:hypothetical protein
VRARLLRLGSGIPALLLAGAAAAQNPYQYVKFSLQVPWTLYFVFLALVTVPFALMILLAWRRASSEEGHRDESPPQAQPKNERPT